MKRTAGFIIFLLSLGAGIFMGGYGSAFIDLPSLVMFLGLTAGLTLIGYYKGISKNELYLKVKRYSVYSGWLIFMTGIISYFSSMTGAFHFGNFAICLIGLFYGYLASYLIECLVERGEKSI